MFPCTLYSLYCSLYILHCTVYNVHCKIYIPNSVHMPVTLKRGIWGQMGLYRWGWRWGAGCFTVLLEHTFKIISVPLNNSESISVFLSVCFLKGGWVVQSPTRANLYNIYVFILSSSNVDNHHHDHHHLEHHRLEHHYLEHHRFNNTLGRLGLNDLSSLL